MKFSNTDIRRQDRLLDEDSAHLLLKKGEYGVLSLLSNNIPYGIPISYAWDDNNSIYLHCAPEGRKLICIDENENVSFCVIGRTNVISEKFTTEFESIVLKCKAFRHLHASERMKALELILDKYSPDDKVVGLKYAEKSFDRTDIIRLDIQEFSGKSKFIGKK